jgi:hypothetical protein
MGALFIERTGYPTLHGLPSYYESFFDTTEDPIREGSTWINGNADSGGSHQQMEAGGGLCFGSAVQTAFDDAICLYNGTSPIIGNDHRVTAWIYIEGGYSGAGASHEIILALRGSINGTNDIPYYEILFQLGSSAGQLFHQSGPEGGYSAIGPGSFSCDIPADGDKLSAQVTGTGANIVIKVWQNDNLLASFTPSASYRINSGKPGLSMYVNSPATPNKGCFTRVLIENASG